MGSAKPLVYAVEIAPAAERALKKMAVDIRKRIFRALTALANQPRPDGVRKLSGADDLYRIRVGDYRVVYQIRDGALVVLVVRIGHRREIYR